MTKDDRTQFTLRLRGPLHKRLKKSARENNCSINTELVERLECSYKLERDRLLAETWRREFFHLTVSLNCLATAVAHIKSLLEARRRKQKDD